MKVFEYIERINRLHDLLKEQKTGTPEQLARRLRISVSRLYQIIEELKIYDVPIEYSRTRRSYYYKYAYEMRITALLRPLNTEENKWIKGGSANRIVIAFRPVTTI